MRSLATTLPTDLLLGGASERVIQVGFDSGDLLRIGSLGENGLVYPADGMIRRRGRAPARSLTPLLPGDVRSAGPRVREFCFSTISAATVGPPSLQLASAGGDVDTGAWIRDHSGFGKELAAAAGALRRRVTAGGSRMQSVTGFRPVALNVGVKDVETAIEFYEAVFAAKLEVGEADGRPVHARWQFGEGDSFFLFNIRARGQNEPHRDHTTAFGFNVEDLDATHRRAVEAGAQEHFPPMDEEGLPRHSRFQDPSGNRIVLWQA